MNTETPSVRVVEAVARAVGDAPETLSPPLYETINPDALDALVAQSSANVHIAFEYKGYEVQVDGAGTVSVASPDTVEGKIPRT